MCGNGQMRTIGNKAFGGVDNDPQLMPMDLETSFEGFVLIRWSGWWHEAVQEKPLHRREGALNCKVPQATSRCAGRQMTDAGALLQPPPSPILGYRTDRRPFQVPPHRRHAAWPLSHMASLGTSPLALSVSCRAETLRRAGSQRRESQPGAVPDNQPRRSLPRRGCDAIDVMRGVGGCAPGSSQTRMQMHPRTYPRTNGDRATALAANIPPVRGPNGQPACPLDTRHTEYCSNTQSLIGCTRRHAD